MANALKPSYPYRLAAALQKRAWQEARPQRKQKCGGLRHCKEPQLTPGPAHPSAWMRSGQALPPSLCSGQHVQGHSCPSGLHQGDPQPQYGALHHFLCLMLRANEGHVSQHRPRNCQGHPSEKAWGLPGSWRKEDRPGHPPCLPTYARAPPGLHREVQTGPEAPWLLLPLPPRL